MSEKKESNSILKQIRQTLRENNIKTYYPGQHVGECTSPYVVIKHDGAMKNMIVSSDMVSYTILCYVPGDQYSTLLNYVDEVKTILKRLYPLIRYTGNETPSYYDDEIKGHMISIEYQNYRKLSDWR